jgi:HD superfamily phosphodiesterase
VLLTDGWECERCGLAWDDGDKAPPCLPMTFARMRQAALEEAERIEFSQSALTTSTATSPALRDRRYQPLLKRAMELRAIVNLIDRVTGDREILDRLKTAGRKTERAA